MMMLTFTLPGCLSLVIFPLKFSSGRLQSRGRGKLSGSQPTALFCACDLSHSLGHSNAGDGFSVEILR